jgi:CBS domain-containing membrane protein
MRRDFVSLGPGDSLLEAERIMRLARIRHLPIVDSDRLVGVLSHRDLLEGAISSAQDVPVDARIEHLRDTNVEQVMRREPWTVEVKTSLREAAVRMLSLKIGCLPVVETRDDGPVMVGLITESDLLRAAYVPE